MGMIKNANTGTRGLQGIVATLVSTAWEVLGVNWEDTHKQVAWEVPGVNREDTPE